MQNEINIQDFRDGDLDAFRNVIKLYEKKVFSLVSTMTRHRQDTEDLVQEIFLKIYKNRKKFEAKSSIYTWIYRIAVNETINYVKKNKKKFEMSFLNDETIDNKENLDKDLVNKETFILVEKAILGLKEKYRTAFLLKELDGMSYLEIASEMGVSVDNVKILLFRAKDKLRQILNKKLGGGISYEY